MIDGLEVDAANVSRSVLALMVVHNRREMTRRSLNGLIAAAENAGVERLGVVLVDDGSSDGTSEMIALEYPFVTVIRSDGTLFWGGAMALAEASARPPRDGFILWLNNDVELHPDAIKEMFGTLGDCGVESVDKTIVCGALCNSSTGDVTYSGMRRRVSRAGIMTTRIVRPSGAPQLVDAFNGNVVLIPASVASELGGVDSIFPHRYGDLDYGMRAGRLGIPILLVPRYIGTCARNGVAGTHLDRALSRRQRMRSFLGTKENPPRARWVYLSRHGGWGWPIQFVGQYAAGLLEIVFSRKLANGV